MTNKFEHMEQNGIWKVSLNIRFTTWGESKSKSIEKNAVLEPYLLMSRTFFFFSPKVPYPCLIPWKVKNQGMKQKKIFCKCDCLMTSNYTKGGRKSKKFRF